MRIHPSVRWALVAAALLVSAAATPTVLAACALIIASCFVLLGLGGRLLKFILLVLPIIGVSAALWLFVLADTFTAESLLRACGQLLEPGSNFISLLRAVTSASLIVIALGAVPDGAAYAVLRSMALPQTVAFVFASGASLVESVQEAAERSVIALRAQGLMKPTFGSRVTNLGRVVGLTWLSSLSLIAHRAETKWSGNGFVDALKRKTRPLATSVWDTAVCFLTIAAIVFVLVTGVEI